MSTEHLLGLGRGGLASLFVALLALGAGGCDDGGGSTWEDLREHEGIGDQERSVIGSVTEEPEGPPGVRPFEVEEITDYGVESSRARIMAEVINPVLDSARELPGYEDWRPAVEGQGRAALLFGQRAAVRGITRLSADDLDAWASLQREILDDLRSQSHAACGRYARGDIDLSFVVEIYNRLDKTRLREFMDLQTRGLLTQLEADDRLPDPTPREVGRALGAVVDAVEGPVYRPGDNNLELAESFQRAVQKERRTAEEECLIARVIWGYYPAIDLDHRRVILRVF